VFRVITTAVYLAAPVRNIVDTPSYIPKTKGVPTVYSVAAVLYLLFMLHVMLFPMLDALYFCISTFLSMCAVHNMTVFYSSLIAC
jgi:hypothetical protein